MFKNYYLRKLQIWKDEEYSRILLEIKEFEQVRRLERDRKFLEIDKEIEAYRQKKQKEMDAIAIKCSEDKANYEHEYHHTMELKGIEIAKLEARLESLKLAVDARQEVINADSNLLKSKDLEIKRLNDLLTVMVNKQPSAVTIQQLKS